MVSVDISKYLQREYEVDCNGQRVRLKPLKAWVLQPRGRKGIIVGLFKCPGGGTVRKSLGKVE